MFDPPCKKIIVVTEFLSYSFVQCILFLHQCTAGMQGFYNQND